MRQVRQKISGHYFQKVTSAIWGWASPEIPKIGVNTTGLNDLCDQTPYQPSGVALFVPQRHHRVDFCRTPRGNVASQQCHTAQHQRDYNKRQRVGGPDTVKQAGD